MICAICTNDIRPGELIVREPLGRGGCEVVVCFDCRMRPVGDPRYSFEGAPPRPARPLRDRSTR